MATMWLCLFVVAWNLCLANAKKDPLPHSTCERTWEKVGCFKDKTKKGMRTLPHQLVNDRDINSDANDGHLIDWKKWEESMLSLACRCANVTRERGWKVFGMQFYGECWSGEDGETNFNNYGEAAPSQCLQELVGNPLPPCDKSKDMECVGAASTNYIYRLKDLKPKDVNGGYSMWSEWTQCSKSCGGGTKSRERTCTNPPPEGGGSGCDHLGEPEDDVKCNEHLCPDPCKKSLDVGLIIDSSGSVGRANFAKMLEFLSDLVANLAISPQGTHVGAIVYQKTPTLHFNLAKSEYHTLSKLQAAIKALRYTGGGTRTDLAMEMAANELFSPAGGDRNDASNLLIVLSDGKTNQGSKPYKTVLNPLQSKGVRVVAVGIGKNIDDAELMEIAAENQQYVMHVNDFDELKNSLKLILTESCQGAGDVDGAWADWSDWTQCSKTCGGGIRVRERSCTNPPPKGNGATCQGELEETGACSENPCPKPCTKALDVGIIIDGSGSVGRTNFKKAKEFVQSLITHFTISSKASHVGVITYSTDSRLEFNFADTKYHDIVELKKRVMEINYPGRWTRTDKALEMAAQKLYTNAGGDRKDKPNVLIVLTDGKTNRGSKPYPEVLQPLQARGVRTVAVGIGHGINNAELRQIAMNDPQYVVQVDNFDALKDKLQMILDESCQGAPPPPPSPECKEGSLGLQSGAIPSDAISVTSMWDGNHGPDRARLNVAASGGKTGGWSARYNDLGQWIQVDLGKVVKITKVAIQGRSDYDQWVTSFWISYSLNNGYYEEYGENSALIFTGNADRNTVKENELEIPLYTRYFRLHPKTWRGHISLRLELFGCTTGFVPPSPPQCMDALGMQSGRIKQDAVHASSQYNSNYGPNNGRLHFQKTGARGGAWVAKDSNPSQWIQAKFDVVAKVRRVAIQGRMDADQWVETYSLAHSFDGKVWTDYKLNNKITIFQGSNDRYTVATEIIDPPIIAQYIRVKPLKWHNHISMRVEFYGCTEDGDICQVHKPCKNGAQCTNVVGGYQCRCPLGFKGKNCDEDVDECAAKKPCKNGAKCTNTQGGYTCTCVGGWFTGKNCDEAPTECFSNTKLSGAQRASGVKRQNFLKCDNRDLPTIGKWHQFVGDAGTKMPNSCVPTQHCGTHAPGWLSGEHPKKEEGVVDRKVCFHWSNNCCRWSVTIKVRNCGGFYVYQLKKAPACFLRYCGDKGHNVCEPKNPCKNNGVCKPQNDGYYCQCKPGYQGKNCDKDIDECAGSNPCKNGGKCTNSQGSYKCTCGAKFTGKNCETDINECVVHKPCKNGATCVNVQGGYSCQCPAAYKGKHCDEDVNECSVNNPCKNGAKCENTKGGYKCTCVGGWFTGKHCDQDPKECSSYSKLSGADRASGAHRGKILKCDRKDFPTTAQWYRFTGDAGSRMPTSPVAKHHCGTHAPGWLDGQHPTKAEGVVKRKVCFHWNSKICNWQIYVSIRNCGDFYVYHLGRTPGCSFRYCGNKGHNTCLARNPCKNGAACKPNGDGLTCQCTANFQGDNCDKDVNECIVKNPCKNGAKCTNTHGSYRCTCDSRFTGKNCDQDVNECVVRKPCKNGATCVNSVGGYSCRCNANFKGKNCDEDVNECDVHRPCKNGGTCTNSVGAYRCNCPANYKGKHCEEDVNECDVHRPCKNGGTCANSIGGYRCNCPANYKGKHCEEDVDECSSSNPCKNGGRCKNSRGGYQCECVGRWFSGKNCDQAPPECSSYTQLSEANRASGAPRGNVLKCDRNDLVAKWYRFTGDAGTQMPTSPVPIHHCGTHAPGWLNGQHPKKEDGAVGRNVCFHWNSKICNWQTAIKVRNCGGFYVYYLVKTSGCHFRYCGNKGHDACRVQNRCKNGAACKPNGDSQTCLCTANFQGETCDKDVNECTVKNPCKNRAKCTNTHGGYKCTCDSRFTGKNCDQDVNECVVRKPCKNGATCVNSVGGYSCRCPANFKGKNCDEDVNECTVQNPCKNGAKCTNTHGSYRCTCDSRFTGKNCDQDVNECVSHKPCKNGGTCVNTVGGYQCKCPSNYKGKNCDEDIDECAANNPCKNGGNCKNTRGSYQCTCVGRWFSGKNCEQGPTECSSYSTLSGADRAASAPAGSKCDRNDLPASAKWYRFTGAAGSQMPTSPVPVSHCGTHATGWLNGQHPKKEDGAVSRKVCFHWSNNICRWHIFVSVRNCGAFYVYHLGRTPGCSFRYCGNKGHDICKVQNPCKNGAACKPEGDDYHCTCPHGYQGKNCDQDVDECAAQKPCRNGAKCTNTRGSYTCACPQRFAGKNCDQVVIPPECKNYVTVSDASRSSGYTGGSAQCDQRNLPTVGKWHRFMGAAGTAMPTACVLKNRCGTHAPGWLNGKHPSEEEGAVTRKVCYHWNDNCCKWNNNIKVRNCGGYFVYQLQKTPVCNLRYCAEKKDPDAPSSCKRAMDIGVIMDRSGSVGADNFKKAKDFVISLVHKLQISSHGTRIGIIPYHSSAEVSVKFAQTGSQNPSAMTSIIRNIPYTSGWTRTDIAIELANSQLFSSSGGDRSDKPNVLIIMTDGKTNSGSKPYKTVLAPLKGKKVRTIAVGVGSGVNEDELLEIADGKRENMVHVSKFDELVSNENNVLFASCQPDAPPPPCQHAMDVGIIMDRSGSVGAANFEKSKKFVTSLAHKLQISSAGTRIGIIAYQTYASVAVKFSQGSSQTPSAMSKVISSIAYTGGGTRTDIALEMANSGLFSSGGGDRSDKPNVLVVLTDGKTNSGSKAYKTVLAPLLGKPVKMIAVGIGSGIDYSELEEIANGRSENVIHVDKFEDLFVRLNSVLKASCER